MSRLTVWFAAAALCALSVAGCSTSGPDRPAPSAPSSAPVQTSPAGASATPAPSPLPAESTTVAEQPVTFECGDPSLYQSGTALYSDGTTGYDASCDTAPTPVAPTLRYCDYGGVAVYTDGGYSSTDPACQDTRPVEETGTSGYPYDPSQDRDGDGTVSGYERCGTLCGEAPTSGETQLQYLCQQGTVTGPSCEGY